MLLDIEAKLNGFAAMREDVDTARAGTTRERGAASGMGGGPPVPSP